MLEQMTERKWHYWTEYKITFDYDETGGYWFPCDENGNLLKDDMTPTAIENYEWCMAHPEKFQTYNRMVSFERKSVEPATGVCKCGHRISLWDEYMGACHCPHCGTWYNLFGQELNHPDTWKDGDDW